MLKRSETMSAEALDKDAEITDADIARARRGLRALYGSGPRRSLSYLADATTDNAGPATGPLNDE